MVALVGALATVLSGNFAGWCVKQSDGACAGSRCTSGVRTGLEPQSSILASSLSILLLVVAVLQDDRLVTLPSRLCGERGIAVVDTCSSVVAGKMYPPTDVLFGVHGVASCEGKARKPWISSSVVFAGDKTR